MRALDEFCHHAQKNPKPAICETVCSHGFKEAALHSDQAGDGALLSFLGMNACVARCSRHSKVESRPAIGDTVCSHGFKEAAMRPGTRLKNV